ncbi:YsnF/AvaK domain-containing protein [Sorangium sp. So ce1000]|uniref:YsnF/AvaK domain-containing protein n=1 Tax=Sorangium sp. So ce1000 TaxID=3133325 RepID=UPI003F636A38
MVTQHEIKQGMLVRSSDGEKLGNVVRIDESRFEIEKGFFFPKEYAVRYDEVSGIRDGEVILMHGRDQLATDRGQASEAGVAAAEEIRVPLVEEEVTAGKTVQEVGRVQVTKEVVTEEKQIAVPVAREVVHVERVPASGERPATSGTMFEEGSLSVPIREERVEVSTRPVVKEELRIGKEVIQDQETAQATVRRETADVRMEGELPRQDDLDEPTAAAPEQPPLGRAAGGGRR